MCLKHHYKIEVHILNISCKKETLDITAAIQYLKKKGCFEKKILLMSGACEIELKGAFYSIRWSNQKIWQNMQTK